MYYKLFQTWRLIYWFSRLDIKKTVINPKNADDKFFQCAAAVTLNFKKIELQSEKISNNKPFINKFN